MINIQLFLGIKVWDKDGHIIRSIYQESRSLVKPFLAIMLAQMSETALSGTHKDTTDNDRTIEDSATSGRVAFAAIGNVNDATKGCVIGTSSTAVDITDTKLVAQIAEGTGAGQMTHQAQTYPGDITISDPDATFATNRDFNNNSGGSITVAETGIYGNGQSAGSTRQFCLVRDTPSSVAVPNGGGCNVAYTFKISE